MSAYPTDLASGITGNQSEVFDWFGNHRTCTDEAIFPEFVAANNSRVGADTGTLADEGGDVLIAPHDGRPRIIDVGENHRRAEKDVIFTDNACVDADIVLHLHVASEFDPWAYNDVLADIARLAEFSSGHDMTKVPDFAAGADLCRRVYDGGRMGKECSRRRVTSDE